MVKKVVKLSGSHFKIIIEEASTVNVLSIYLFIKVVVYFLY